MRFTERDIEILKFINEFGFCEIVQLQQEFKLNKARSYQIMERLKKANLVKHERIFHGKFGVYSVTNYGATCTDLPPLQNIPKDNYLHQLTVMKVYFQIKNQFPGAVWLSERRIKREKDDYCVGKRVKHLADGIVILPNAKEVAIEVELTMKSQKRLREIIQGYALHQHINEVWYFCPKETADKVKKVAGNWEHIRIKTIN